MRGRGDSFDDSVPPRFGNTGSWTQHSSLLRALCQGHRPPCPLHGCMGQWVEGGQEQEQRRRERDMNEEQGKPDPSQLYHYLLAKRESSEVLGLSSLSKIRKRRNQTPSRDLALIQWEVTGCGSARSESGDQPIIDGHAVFCKSLPRIRALPFSSLTHTRTTL